MSDDATVWADYHHAEIRQRDKKIASLTESFANASARIWVLEKQLDKRTVQLIKALALLRKLTTRYSRVAIIDFLAHIGEV